MIILYDYPNSTACFRVRIALHYKKILFESRLVHLLDNGGQQHTPEFQHLNPQNLVPALQHKTKILTQSLAIIEYLDEVHPEPSLLPKSSIDKAEVRRLAQIIACDIHPLNNLRILNYLSDDLACDQAQKTAWYHHWLKRGFDAIEALLTNSDRETNFCFGHSVSLADLCLIPQVFNANRFGFDLTPYPQVLQINDACLKLTAFKKAHP